jgi:hypothetical protein
LKCLLEMSKAQMTSIEGNLDVLVANDEQIISGGICRGVSIRLGRAIFQVDFYILRIEGCEVILRAIWLKLLGPILWDFFKSYG